MKKFHILFLLLALSPAPFALCQQFGWQDISYNLQDYPLNTTTAIDYCIPEKAYVTLKAFYMQGREITTLVSGSLPPGNHSASFNASSLPGGIYFYQLRTDEFVQTKKLIIQ